MMPISQVAYQDVGLDYVYKEFLETSEDSQRVTYEDPSIELLAKLATRLVSEADSVQTTGKAEEFSTDLTLVTIPCLLTCHSSWKPSRSILVWEEELLGLLSNKILKVFTKCFAIQMNISFRDLASGNS